MLYTIVKNRTTTFKNPLEFRADRLQHLLGTDQNRKQLFTSCHFKTSRLDIFISLNPCLKELKKNPSSLSHNACVLSAES